MWLPHHLTNRLTVNLSRKINGKTINLIEINFLTYPQCLPMTSIINVRWCEYAVLTIASIASMIRCSAESVPIVMSVPQKSLSIDPTMPAICKWLNLLRCSGVIRASFSNSSNKLDHSSRNKFAPVKEPSPPITIFCFNFYKDMKI